MGLKSQLTEVDQLTNYMYNLGPGVELGTIAKELEPAVRLGLKHRTSGSQVQRPDS